MITSKGLSCFWVALAHPLPMAHWLILFAFAFAAPGSVSFSLCHFFPLSHLIWGEREKNKKKKLHFFVFFLFLLLHLCFFVFLFLLLLPSLILFACEQKQRGYKLTWPNPILAPLSHFICLWAAKRALAFAVGFYSYLNANKNNRAQGLFILIWMRIKIRKQAKDELA